MSQARTYTESACSPNSVFIIGEDGPEPVKFHTEVIVKEDNIKQFAGAQIGEVLVEVLIPQNEHGRYKSAVLKRDCVFNTLKDAWCACFDDLVYVPPRGKDGRAIKPAIDKSLH